VPKGYASLGFNCEAAYQFRRVIGHDVASYFNWTYNKPRSIISLVTSNFANIIDRDTVWRDSLMFYESRHDISYHGDIFNKSDNRKDADAFEAQFLASESKMNFLRDRWLTIARGDTEMTYFLKIKEDDASLPPAREVAKQIRDTFIETYPDHAFKIVALMSLEYSKYEQDWGEPRIFNRYLTAFAPDAAPEKGNVGDWDRVFEEFPIKSDASD
jgi:hypothetical protein